MAESELDAESSALSARPQSLARRSPQTRSNRPRPSAESRDIAPSRPSRTVGSIAPRVEAKKVAPNWTEQANWRPEKSYLLQLESEVQAAPQDRRKRNSLCWALLHGGHMKKLKAQALDWQAYDPRNPMVYEYLGVAFDYMKNKSEATRAFSTIAEIAPGESGLLNRAGFLALKAGEASMAETLFRFAVKRRPEHANNYRGLAMALWKQSKHKEAAEVYETALKQDYHSRYKNVKRVLREEASELLSAWKFVGEAAEVHEWSKKLNAPPVSKHDVRITLHWETDANDVDLHVVDPRGDESYYSKKQTASGVVLYEDLTQGLGPEVTVVPTGKIIPGRYHVGVKYFSAGPMGVSRGVVTISQPSVDGGLDVAIHPFTLLPDLAGRKQDMRHVAALDSGN